MKKLLIVVFGEKRHGKNEVARAIAEKLGGLTVAFADALKLGVEMLVGVPHDLPDAEKETRLFYGRTARYWWQWYGTEVGRQGVDANVWVDRIVDYMRRAPHGMVVSVSDGRFYNERVVPSERLAEAVDALIAGEVDEIVVMNVLVFRPGLPETDMHASETEVRDMRKRALAGEQLFDEVILNDGTLEELVEKAERVAIQVAR